MALKIKASKPGSGSEKGNFNSKSHFMIFEDGYFFSQSRQVVSVEETFRSHL